MTIDNKLYGGEPKVSKEKQEILERMAEKFSEIKQEDTKSYAVICMTAFASGKEAGIAEERKRWKEKELVEALE